MSEAIPADELAEALAKAGYTPEQIQASTSLYAENKYKPKTVKLKPQRFLLAKDGQADYFDQKITVRYLNAHDIRRLVPVIYSGIMSLMIERGSNDDINELLSMAGPKGIFELLSAELEAMQGNDEYPEWAVKLLEEIALILSSKELTVTAEDLVSLPGRQFPALLAKLWEVNSNDFLYVLKLVWGKLPKKVREFISSKTSTLVSKTMKSLNWKDEKSQTPSETLSSGGQDNGGNLSSSSHSEKTEESPKQSLAPLA